MYFCLLSFLFLFYIFVNNVPLFIAELLGEFCQVLILKSSFLPALQSGLWLHIGLFYVGCMLEPPGEFKKKKKKYRCLALAHRRFWFSYSGVRPELCLFWAGRPEKLWPFLAPLAPPPALAHSLTQPFRWYHSSGWERKEMAPLAGDPDGRLLSPTPALSRARLLPSWRHFQAYFTISLWGQNTFNWRADPRGGRVWKEFEMMKMFCRKTAVMVAQPCE